MFKDILNNAPERQILAKRILNSVMEEIPDVAGFLGIGSFWNNGELGRHGGSEKDIDLLAVVSDGFDWKSNKEVLIDKIDSKSKFILYVTSNLENNIIHGVMEKIK